jgi:hypothetical protein
LYSITKIIPRFYPQIDHAFYQQKKIIYAQIRKIGMNTLFLIEIDLSKSRKKFISLIEPDIWLPTE